MDLWVWAVLVAVGALGVWAVRRYANTSIGFRVVAMVGLLVASGVCTAVALGYLESSHTAGIRAGQAVVLTVFFFVFAAAALASVVFVASRMRAESKSRPQGRVRGMDDGGGSRSRDVA